MTFAQTEQKQLALVIGNANYEHGRKLKNPVNDANLMATSLQDLGITKVVGYRLPTEAEWEYAARSGTTTPFNTGSNLTISQANYNGNYPYNNNSKGTYREKTIAVGSFSANSWGLYDMHGNIYEWCHDWYDDYSGNDTNPIGSTKYYPIRVVRGGNWRCYATGCRVSNRNNHTPDFQYHGIGFRIARNQ